MKKIILSILLLVVVALGAIGALAPKEFLIEREVVINKPAPEVYAFVKQLKNNGQWNPWMKKDPNLKVEFRGTDGEVGAVASWAGNREVGVGEQEVKTLIDNQRIDFELRFKEPFAGTDSGYYVTEPVGAAQTKVRWGMRGHSPFPMNIFCTLMRMSKMMEKEFDAGLSNLKAVLEKS